MSNLQEIFDKYNNYNFSIESSMYKTKSKTLQLLISYDDNILLTDEVQQTIYDYLTKHYQELKNIIVKYKKNYIDSNILSSYIFKIIKREFPIIELQTKCDFDEINDIITLYAFEKYSKTIEEHDLTSFLKNYLKKIFKKDYQVVIALEKDQQIQEKESDLFIITETKTDEIKLTSVQPIIGESIEEKPRLIVSIDKPCEGVSICGIIKNFVQCKTKEKIVDGKLKPEKTYYKFEVIDYTGSMSVVYFPTKTNLPKMEKLANNIEIFIYGNIEEDSFNAGLTMRPKSINLCLLPEKFFERKYCKPVPLNYKYIFPEKYEVKQQVQLFTEEVFEIKSDYTKSNTFVVFDLETTGVEYNKDKIIEIGAIKIVNGVMTETFSCLIDPEMHIPEGATKVNGIVDRDVKGQKKMGEVIGDFYKFCDGSIMVSYVIDFDFKFIDFNARQYGYQFDNKTLDAFVLAKQKLQGLKNYKLGTVCVACGVVLENAHRAVYDAIAAAEVMVKLLEK